MKYLFCLLTSFLPSPLLYLARRPTASGKVTLSVIFLGSLYLLFGALRPGQDLRNREQRLTALTGLVGLLFGALELCWDFDVGSLQSRSVGTAYYFAAHLVGGISVAMLSYVASPKNPRIVLVLSGVSFVAFNLFAIAHYDPRHLASAVHLASLWNGLFIGASTTSAIILWLDLDKHKRSLGGNGEVVTRGTTGGSGRQA